VGRSFRGEEMARGEANDNTYIRTFSGGYFWPLDPRPEDLKIEDIAHALSNLCRWTGHSREFYSVAQHCVLVSENVPPLVKLEGLLHDASEAYLADLARPIKHAPGLGDVYRKVERKLELVIAEKFNLPSEFSPIVKTVDSRLLMTEKRDLMVGDWNEQHVEGAKPFNFSIEPWSPKQAEQEFLQRYHILTSPTMFTTGEWAEQIGLSRHAALVRLKKQEKRGVVERCLVLQNQGGVVRKNVVGWRYTGDRRVSVDTEEDSALVTRS
jgi:5'-deoxynucleotidase YfbR-like HD superfamily hydrolase